MSTYDFIYNKYFFARYHIEESKTNHFMYWTTSRKHLDDAFSPPTRIVSDDFTFNAWSERAELADTAKLDNTSHHWYFMTGSKRTDNDKNFVYRDFPIFRSEEPNFFIPAPKYNKGSALHTLRNINFMR